MASPIREDLSTESSIECSHSNSASTTGRDCFWRSSYRSSSVLFLISSSTLWASNPNIRLCYVVAGTWEEPAHIVESSKSVKERLLQKRCFEEIELDFIDNKALVNIINSNESC